MRAIQASSLFALLASLVAGCATNDSQGTQAPGGGGKGDNGGEEAGLYVTALTTTLGPENEIRWPVVVDDSSDADDKINGAISFEAIAGDTLEAVVANWSTSDETHQGIQAGDYVVNGNVRNVLSLSITLEYLGAYSDFGTTYLNFNSNTGDAVAITDILDESSLPTIAAQLDRKLQDEIAQLKVDLADDIASGNVSADQWDNLHVTAEDLSSFSTTPAGITFHWDSGFPHAIQGLAPDGELSLTIDELDADIKADGLWAGEF